MRRLAVLVSASFVVVFTSWVAEASAPRLVNYQGILTDSGGSPITGTHDLTFSVYPDSVPAAPVYWTETHTGVPLDNGLFNVILGGVVALHDSLFAGRDRWMGITVDVGQEMIPRVQITSVPWAFRAATADSAGNVGWTGISGMPPGFADGIDDVGGGGSDNDWTVVGDMMYSAVAGSVGIGTATPTAKLDVEGSLNVHSSGDGATVLRLDTERAWEFRQLNTGPATALELANLTGNKNFVINTAGSVGIGTTNPTYRLDVNGYVRGLRLVASSAQTVTRDTETDQVRISGGTKLDFQTDGIRGAGIVLEGRDYGGADAGGRLSFFAMNDKRTRFSNVDGDGVVTDHMTIDGNGYVGIGTTTPTEQLDVNLGDIRVRGPDSFVSPGHQATLYFGDGNHYIRAEAGAGVSIGTYLAPDAITIEQGTGNVGIAGTTSTGVLQITGGSDLAEPFDISDAQELEPGSVVVIDELRTGTLKISTMSYDTRVAGVISGAGGINTGLTLSQEGLVEGGQNVALSGRVYVRAITSNGAIRPGDLLTTSSVPGLAMKATDADKMRGAILGKAMSTLEAGEGLILVLVSLQ